MRYDRSSENERHLLLAELERPLVLANLQELRHTLLIGRKSGHFPNNFSDKLDALAEPLQGTESFSQALAQEAGCSCILLWKPRMSPWAHQIHQSTRYFLIFISHSRSRGLFRSKDARYLLPSAVPVWQPSPSLLLGGPCSGQRRSP